MPIQLQATALSDQGLRRETCPLGAWRQDQRAHQRRQTSSRTPIGTGKSSSLHGALRARLGEERSTIANGKVVRATIGGQALLTSSLHEAASCTPG